MDQKSVRAGQDKDMEQVMGNLLRYGVILAAIVASAGGIMYLVLHGGDAQPSYAIFNGEPERYKSLQGVLQGVKVFDTSSIMQLGVLLLIATPIARILFSILSFMREKDYLYVIISTIVILIIAFSLFNGLGG
ncbi:MAG: DUF1634 domain-containing protein [Flavipsychrobacter sp.]|nr:DUF1634 domain-containing protein [Flavipsychrobacter sp.]